MISLIVTSAVGLNPRTAIPVNMNALPHIATRANSSSQWPSGRVIESSPVGVSSRGAADLEQDDADRDQAGREHAAGAERLAQQPGADQRGGDINFNAIPLARRIEALRRVLENPAPALARLCTLLATQRAAVEAAFRPYRPRATCSYSQARYRGASDADAIHSRRPRTFW